MCFTIRDKRNQKNGKGLVKMTSRDFYARDNSLDEIESLMAMPTAIYKYKINSFSLLQALAITQSTTINSIVDTFQ